MSESNLSVLTFPSTLEEARHPSWIAARIRSVHPLSFPLHGQEFDPSPEADAPPETEAPSAPRIDPELEAAQRRAIAELEEQARNFARAAAELATARAELLENAESEILDLAIEVARGIVEREIDRDQEQHRLLVRAALRPFGDMPSVILRASPEAYDAIHGVFGDTRVEIDGVQIGLRSDSSLTGLGCIAETERGLCDGRLQERLRRVREALDEEQRRQREEKTER